MPLPNFDNRQDAKYCEEIKDIQKRYSRIWHMCCTQSTQLNLQGLPEIVDGLAIFLTEFATRSRFTPQAKATIG